MNSIPWHKLVSTAEALRWISVASICKIPICYHFVLLLLCGLLGICWTRKNWWILSEPVQLESAPYFLPHFFSARILTNPVVVKLRINQPSRLYCWLLQGCHQQINTVIGLNESNIWRHSNLKCGIDSSITGTKSSILCRHGARMSSCVWGWHLCWHCTLNNRPILPRPVWFDSESSTYSDSGFYLRRMNNRKENLWQGSWGIGVLNESQ
jgi:hypothetical protein